MKPTFAIVQQAMLSSHFAGKLEYFLGGSRRIGQNLRFARPVILLHPEARKKPICVPSNFWYMFNKTVLKELQ